MVKKNADESHGRNEKKKHLKETTDSFPNSVSSNSLSQMLHVCYIYHTLIPLKSTIHVGKYTSPMDPMGYGMKLQLFVFSEKKTKFSLEKLVIWHKRIDSELPTVDGHQKSGEKTS